MEAHAAVLLCSGWSAWHVGSQEGGGAFPAAAPGPEAALLEPPLAPFEPTPARDSQAPTPHRSKNPGLLAPAAQRSAGPGP